MCVILPVANQTWKPDLKKLGKNVFAGYREGKKKNRTTESFWSYLDDFQSHTVEFFSMLWLTLQGARFAKLCLSKLRPWMVQVLLMGDFWIVLGGGGLVLHCIISKKAQNLLTLEMFFFFVWAIYPISTPTLYKWKNIS